MTHYESVGKTPESRIAVNARMLPPANITGVPVSQFDGATSWTFIER